MLEFRILGPLEVVGDAGPIRLGGLKQRATLAILLLGANRVVPVERLADELYAGAPPVTAVTQVQRQVSELRKVLGSVSAIETRAPGYTIRLSPEQLDLNVFERRLEAGREALDRGHTQRAADLMQDALRAWRGSPLADLADESFAQLAIERLEEMRLVALELQIEAGLALGRHADLVGELELLVAEHRLRERFHGQLMLALYRSGRQAEALGVYRRTREALVAEFGIEPSPALRDLERRILSQELSLDLERPLVGGGAVRVDPDRAVLIVSSDESRLDSLVAIGEPLASLPGRELIIARLLSDDTQLAEAAFALNARRTELKAPARCAAFTTLEPALDVVRLATAYDVDLVLADHPGNLQGDSLPNDLAVILERSPADVALLAGRVDLRNGDGVYVPFGGSTHDWAALEIGAWLSTATGASLRLVGLRARPGRRDASRLLADASLAVQRIVGLESEPLLVEPSELALAAAVDRAALVVIGISPRWKHEGVGAVRHALVRDARPPILLVHAGPRPGGLAPRESRSRFSWSINA
jgi:DNA-binding SARP family transcriptional activator